MAGSSSGAAAFQWGNKQAGTESSYESMFYNGEWYNLYDCVFCRSGRKTPFVGKLMRLFEDEAGVKKVCIRWFFRPYELPLPVIKGLSNDINNTNELFIALGNVKGVENENVVEVICGKAMVLCTAKFDGNVIPSLALVGRVDYFFNRVYDVAKQKIVKMVNVPNKQLALKIANKTEWLVETGQGNVEDFQSIAIKEGESSMAEVVEKRHFARSSFMESCASPSKRLKGERKHPNNSIQVANVALVS